VAAYDRRFPLVIDPVMVYSTCLAGSNGDCATCVLAAGDGSAYACGTTYSSDFPTANVPQPAMHGTGFLTRMNAS
jgi:hypothetical protein